MKKIAVCCFCKINVVNWKLANPVPSMAWLLHTPHSITCRRGKGFLVAAWICCWCISVCVCPYKTNANMEIDIVIIMIICSRPTKVSRKFIRVRMNAYIWFLSSFFLLSGIFVGMTRKSNIYYIHIQSHAQFIC